MADRFQIKADGRDRLDILPILSIFLTSTHLEKKHFFYRTEEN